MTSQGHSLSWDLRSLVVSFLAGKDLQSLEQTSRAWLQAVSTATKYWNSLRLCESSTRLPSLGS